MCILFPHSHVLTDTVLGILLTRLGNDIVAAAYPELLNTFARGGGKFNG
jgi:hypothetical protein